MKAGATRHQLVLPLVAGARSSSSGRAAALPPSRLLLAVLVLCLAGGAERGEGHAAGETGGRAVDVGVILDRTTWLGNVSWACMELALEDFYGDAARASYRTRVRLHLRDTSPSAVDAASAGKSGELARSLARSSHTHLVVNILISSLVPTSPRFDI